jgi:hypothetical protein
MSRFFLELGRFTAGVCVGSFLGGFVAGLGPPLIGRAIEHIPLLL